MLNKSFFRLFMGLGLSLSTLLLGFSYLIDTPANPSTSVFVPSPQLLTPLTLNTHPWQTSLPEDLAQDKRIIELSYKQQSKAEELKAVAYRYEGALKYLRHTAENRQAFPGIYYSVDPLAQLHKRKRVGLFHQKVVNALSLPVLDARLAMKEARYRDALASLKLAIDWNLWLSNHSNQVIVIAAAYGNLKRSLLVYCDLLSVLELNSAELNIERAYLEQLDFTPLGLRQGYRYEAESAKTMVRLLGGKVSTAEVATLPMAFRQARGLTQLPVLGAYWYHPHRATLQVETFYDGVQKAYGRFPRYKNDDFPICPVTRPLQVGLPNGLHQQIWNASCPKFILAEPPLTLTDAVTLLKLGLQAKQHELKGQPLAESLKRLAAQHKHSSLLVSDGLSLELDERQNMLKLTSKAEQTDTYKLVFKKANKSES